MEKKIDLRVQKTRKALTDALYRLMSKKSLDNITVTELCKEAVIRKATFYKHFGDKTDLLIYMIQELQRVSYENNTIDYDPSNPPSYYVGAFKFFIDFIDENKEFVKGVLQSNSSLFVREILEDQIRYEIDKQLRQETREDVREAHDMLSNMYAGAIVSCGVWWFTQNNKVKKEEIISEFSKFIIRL